LIPVDPQLGQFCCNTILNAYCGAGGFVGAGLLVGLAVGAGGLAVGFLVGTGVLLGSGVGVSVSVGTGVSVGTRVKVGVGVGVGVSVGIGVGVAVKVAVKVGLGVLVGVAVGSDRPASSEPPERATMTAKQATMVTITVIATSRITTRLFIVIVTPLCTFAEQLAAHYTTLSMDDKSRAAAISYQISAIGSPQSVVRSG